MAQMYDNFVLENQVKSALDTKLDINRFITADYSLVENPGMVKKVHRYHIADGSDVEELARGASNTKTISAEFDEYEYRVGRTQGKVEYADDDLFTDPVYVESSLNFAADKMVNKWVADGFKEYLKSENLVPISNYDYSDFANIISAYTSEHEDTAGLFFLINQKLDAKIRKLLCDHLEFTEGYLKTGAIYGIYGVPVFLSKAVPENLVILATKEAVTGFFKRDLNVETSRDIESKMNKMIISRYAVIALTRPDKCVIAGPAQTAPTITTKTGTSVAGTCEAGASVIVSVGGKDYTAVVTDTAFAATVDAMTAGDAIKVVVSVPGKINAILRDTAV